MKSNHRLGRKALKRRQEPENVFPMEQVGFERLFKFTSYLKEVVQ